MESLEQIRQEFEKTLTYPERVGQKQFFLCPVGLVGAGKTTVIKPLAEKLSLVRISSDELRKILKETNVGYDKLLDILKPLVAKIAEQNYGIAFDADCGNPQTKKLIEELAQKRNALIFWIQINTPEETIIERLKLRNPAPLFINAEQAIENYFKQKKKREEENTAFTFLSSIDTSRNDLTKQIEDTAELIQNKLRE